MKKKKKKTRHGGRQAESGVKTWNSERETAAAVCRLLFFWLRFTVNFVADLGTKPQTRC